MNVTAKLRRAVFVLMNGTFGHILFINYRKDTNTVAWRVLRYYPHTLQIIRFVNYNFYLLLCSLVI